MNDFNSPSDIPSEDSIRFGEWLERMAESRGSSEDEILEQLISSYWKVQELSEILQGLEQYDESDETASRFDNKSVVHVAGTEFEKFRAEVNDRIGDLGTRMNALESEVQSSDDDDAAELKRRIDNEFATIRKILNHLIDATEANRADLAALEDEIVEGDSEFQVEIQRLAHLRQQAMSLGIDSGDCGYCGTVVDLSLLVSPRCPNCGRYFTDIEPRKTVFGIGIRRSTLRTAPYSAPSPLNPEGSIAVQGRNVDDGQKIDGFVWGEDR